MAEFSPKEIPEEHWKPFTAEKSYAVRSNSVEDVHLRLGAGGVFLSITGGNNESRVINSVPLTDGDPVVLGNLDQGKSISLGRTTECDIVIHHAIVSRKHVELSLEGNILVVKDLGSTNGTSCHIENFFFNIEGYLSKHPTAHAPESTMDDVHEAFGPAIDDFLARFTQPKKKE